MADINEKQPTPEPNAGGDQPEKIVPPTKKRKRSKGTGGGMTVAEAGRKGGQAVRDKYGPGVRCRANGFSGASSGVVDAPAPLAPPQ